MFGIRIEQGRLAEVKAMVDAGAANIVAHELFSVGPQRAKNQGSCLIDPEEEYQNILDTARHQAETKTLASELPQAMAFKVLIL